MIQLLLDAGGDPNHRYTGRVPLLPPIEGFTPIMSAARKGHSETVGVLAEGGAEINSRDFYHGSALWYAVNGGHIETVRVLLDSGADIEENHWGATPLSEAARLNYVDLVQLLLKRGANRDAALERAKRSMNPSMIELLERDSRAREPLL